MNILMTNHHLNLFRGSETATYTMAVALKNMGHEVYVFTGEPGHVADVLKTKGIKVSMNLEKWKDIKFDVVHCHHWPLAEMVRKQWKTLPMVYLSHGILPDLEKPPSFKVGVAIYAGVSEEVRDMLVDEYSIDEDDVRIMRNAVNCERFKQDVLIADRPQRIIALSNHFLPHCAAVVREACKRLGYKFWLVGLETTPVWDTESVINRSDLVITLGRGCLEAMACGRAVLVYDMHGGDGMLRPRNWEHIRRHNFSGRRFKINYDIDLMAKEIVGYSKEMGYQNREYVLEHHNANIEALKWVDLYKRAIEIGVP